MCRWAGVTASACRMYVSLMVFIVGIGGVSWIYSDVQM